MPAKNKANCFDKLEPPSEHDEQAQFVRMVEAAYPPGVAMLLFAIPNGGRRPIKTACDLKAEGVRPGVPDLFLAYPHKGAAGLFIEMKRREGGTLSAVQRYYINLLRGQGYAVEVCKGCDEAFDAVRRYLGR